MGAYLAMPLPAASERAANQVARLLVEFDDGCATYVATGRGLPSVRAYLAELRPLIVQAVSAAFRQVDRGVGQETIAQAVDAQLAAIQRVLAKAERDARRDRRKVPARLPEPGDDESHAAFVVRVGAIAAVAALAARPRRRRPAGRTPPPVTGDDVRTLARQVGARLPRPTAAHARMIVRTETAIARNTHAANIVDAKNPHSAKGGNDPRNPWAVLILDARKGPTDEACERVNGKYATPDWLRKHPVEHPNCTRLGRPVRLPAGEHVTLLG